MSSISEKPLYTKCGTQICFDYTRIEHGGRGDYIEVSRSQIVWDNIFVPDDKKWKLDNPNVDYIEYRTKDKCYVKLYLQKRHVDYAEYNIDFFYVSPRNVLPFNQSITRFFP